MLLPRKNVQSPAIVIELKYNKINDRHEEIPIGVQDFETLRKGGYVYVDKSELVYNLTRGHIYFLSRPRRFGKSLLVSKTGTVEEWAVE